MVGVGLTITVSALQTRPVFTSNWRLSRSSSIQRWGTPDEAEENIWTLLNPFKQAPSATKREVEEYKRTPGSTPRTTSNSDVHLKERYGKGVTTSSGDEEGAEDDAS